MAELECWTFDAVEARLVEAFGFQRRMPGGGAGLGARTMALWRMVSPTAGMNAVERAEWLLNGVPDAPRPGGLSTAEVERMNEALAWARFVRAGLDRLIMGAALGQLAAGGSRVSWIGVRDALRRGAGAALLPQHMREGRGGEGLRKRYSRAITAICVGLNGGAQVHRGAVNPHYLQDAK